MADDKNLKKTANALNAEGTTIETFLPDLAPAAGSESLMVESAIYNSELCVYDDPRTNVKENYPVQGYLVDARPMTSQKYGDFMGYVIQLTKACGVPKEPGSRDLKLLPIGAEIIIPGKTKTNDLEQYVGRERVAHLWCKPKGKIKTGTGHTMEEWQIACLGHESRDKVARSSKLIAALGDRVTPAAQLDGGNAPQLAS